MRGQIGIFAIVGIIIVVAVIAMFVLQPVPTGPSPIPPAVAEEQKTVSDFVNNFIRSGGVTTIKFMENHAGYLGEADDLEDVAVYSGTIVPYWQMCDTNYAPTDSGLNQNLEIGVKNYLTNFLNRSMTAGGKEVTFDFSKLRVDAKVYENRIDYIVTLPTQIDEYLIDRPYEVSIPTEFGRISHFYQDLVAEMAENRPFETFTEMTLSFWPNLPRLGFMGTCGESIYVSGQEQADELKKVIIYVLTNTEWWKLMESTAGTDRTFTYAIDKVNGKTYQDISPSMALPDGFEYQITSPIMIGNYDLFMTTNYVSPPECARMYLQDYSFHYPIIFIVKDRLLDNDFVIAGKVFLDEETSPGDCDAIGLYKGLCNDTVYMGEISAGYIKVLNENRDPLEGAALSYGGCFVNTSDSDGEVLGNVPREAGTGAAMALEVSADGYAPYKENKKISGQSGIEVQLHRMPHLYFNFVHLDSRIPLDSEVVMLNLTSKDTGRTYMIMNQNPGYNETPCLIREGYQDDCKTCDDSILESSNESDETLIDQDACTACNKGKSLCLQDPEALQNTVEVNYIPGGQYTVSAMVMNPSKAAQGTASMVTMFLAVPISTVIIPFTSPEVNSSVYVEVEDSDSIYYIASYNYAIWKPHKYATCKNDMQCDTSTWAPFLIPLYNVIPYFYGLSQEEIGSAKECRQICAQVAEGMAARDVMTFVNDYPAKIEMEVVPL